MNLCISVLSDFMQLSRQLVTVANNLSASPGHPLRGSSTVCTSRQWRIHGGIYLDQTEARRAEKKIFDTAPPPPPPPPFPTPLSEGLERPLPVDN